MGLDGLFLDGEGPGEVEVVLHFDDEVFPFELGSGEFDVLNVGAVGCA